MVRMVKLDEEVYQDLTSLGYFKETYSDIIRRVVEFYKHNNNKNKDNKEKLKK